MFTPSDGASVSLYPELRRLASLRTDRRWSFAPIFRDGELDLVAGALLWPDRWSDAIAIRDRLDARAFRCDPAGGEVWSREGGVAEVIDGLAELPAPGEPGAPRLIRARAPALLITSQLPRTTSQNFGVSS